MRPPSRLIEPLTDSGRAAKATWGSHDGAYSTQAPRVIGVSESPHLLGRFVALDLRRRSRADFDPRGNPLLRSIVADPLAETPAYRRYTARTNGP